MEAKDIISDIQRTLDEQRQLVAFSVQQREEVYHYLMLILAKPFDYLELALFSVLLLLIKFCGHSGTTSKSCFSTRYFKGDAQVFY